MSGREGGRGRRRRPFRRDGRQDHFGQGQDSRSEGKNRGDPWKRPREKPRELSVCDKNGVLYERPRWTAPRLNTDPLPVPVCVRCGQPITDLHAALTDKSTGGVVHFDCAMAELAARESLEEGDRLSYIGGGRFGVVYFEHAQPKIFKIKKVIEWEMPENRPLWREDIADHFSLT